MGTAAEVVFEPKKHVNLQKGSLVGEKTQGVGYLVYPMPPVGAFDPTTAPQMLQEIGSEMTRGSAPGAEFERIEGSAKAKRKAADKARRRAMVAYLAQ